MNTVEQVLRDMINEHLGEPNPPEKDIYSGDSWGTKIIQTIKECNGISYFAIANCRMKYSIIEEPGDGRICYADKTLEWKQITSVLEFLGAPTPEVQKSLFPMNSTATIKETGEKVYIDRFQINEENNVIFQVTIRESELFEEGYVPDKWFTVDELERR